MGLDVDVHDMGSCYLKRTFTVGNGSRFLLAIIVSATVRQPTIVFYGKCEKEMAAISEKLTFILVAWANPTKIRMPHKALKEVNVQVQK